MRSAAVCLLLLAAACGVRAAPPLAPAPRAGAGAAPAVRVPAPPARRPAPSVRVVLTAPTDARGARVVVKGAWSMVSAEGATLRSGAGLDGDLVLDASSSTLAGMTFPFDAELRPAQDGDLRVGERTYAGALRAERGGRTGAQALVTLPVETYVACVVNGEIPAAFPGEAQRVQAILARSYALASAPRTGADAPLVLHDVGGIDQEFTGLAPAAAHRRIAEEAVRTTAGLVLVEDGAPVIAYYHSTCGGVTCPGGVVFGERGAGRALTGGIVCPWCESSKYRVWNATVPAGEVLRAAGLTGVLEGFSVAETTAGGRAASFDVTADGRTRRVRAAEFRLRAGPSLVRSVFLEDAAVRDGALVLRGRGWGHGVGLCQMGAKTLAEKGMSAEAILAVYYPGVALERRW